MKKYRPNFTDPRVQRKCKAALTWATCMLKEDQPQSWSRTHLDRKIGYSHTQLGSWLRQHLLTVTDPGFSRAQRKTKQYVLDLRGAKLIADSLGISYNPRKLRKTIAVQSAIEHYKPQFLSGVFEYTLKSNRLYNDMQYIKTDIRTGLFAHYGFRFNYDIQCAFPTLIQQLALSTASYRQPFRELASYVNNSREYRQRLSACIGCDYDTAKQILIAKFNGATLRPHASIPRMLTRIQLHKLKHSVQFTQLNKDMQRLWKGIARSMGQNSISPRQRMHKYLCIERQVQQVVRRKFSEISSLIFLEHDGWRSQDYVDPHLLELSIYKHTGYSVRITCDIVSNNTEFR